jgi:nicotinamide-nucleotide amidase
MANGVLSHTQVELSVAVTGIAGPGGGSADKPVGLVHLAVNRRGGKLVSEQQIFPGDRDAIRRATVIRALELLLAAAEA